MTLLSYRRTRSSEASKQASVEGGTGIQSQMNLPRPPPSFQHVRPTEMWFPRKRREFPQQHSQKENTNRAPTLHFGIGRERELIRLARRARETSEWSGVGSERTHNKPGQGRRASVASMALSIIDRSVEGISSRVRIQNTHTHTHTRVFQSHDVTHPISTERERWR